MKPDHVRNDSVREIMRVDSVLIDDIHQPIWLDHVHRIDGKGLSSKAAPERPNRSWLGRLTETLAKRGLEWMVSGNRTTSTDILNRYDVDDGLDGNTANVR